MKFHPLADIFPLLEGAEFDALVADIKANGLREPIMLHEGMVLDGRNRYRAYIAAGFDEARITSKVLVHSGVGDDPAAYVISANIHRRHLTVDQKRDLIAKLVKAQPEKSDRQIAKTAKVDHKTVGAARAKLEGRGEIPHVETRTDTKGRKQPAKKKSIRVRNDAEDIRAKHAGVDARLQKAVTALVKRDADMGLIPETAVDTDRLAEKLREAEIKIAGLESEVEELKQENARLRKELDEARASEPLAANDPGTRH